MKGSHDIRSETNHGTLSDSGRAVMVTPLAERRGISEESLGA